ncbi:LysE family translocator [Methylovirgula sp. 4M-Z18]|uniref:LysE family translocator n=1 Tax=Methylovirgula sp. 4M-Z18 TaxID=2293567 RepID=UPI000E2E9CBD|nr:LysE family translocator [Methylovirgula sp. 4M-Z18]RFB81461.1 LysE family translocator [Methylovirgula sp. 4M-Z18]
MSLAFLVTSFLVVASPGTGAIYTLATGLTRGPRAAVVAAFGCTLGIVPHMIAAIAGAAAILHTSAVAFQGVKYLGVGYLLYMAWHALREIGAIDVAPQNIIRSHMQIIVKAILINILNPKLSIFFLAFLPQFVDVANAHALITMLTQSAVFMLMTFVVFAIYGLCAAIMRDHVIARPKVLTWLRRSFAGAFILLSAKLAFAER